MANKVISELIRISIKPGFEIASPSFARLRQSAVEGGAREQYYGLSHLYGGKTERHLCWVIQWPTLGPLKSEEFRHPLKELDADGIPKSWLIPFDDPRLPRRALMSPLCELCTVQIKPQTNIELIATSLHKTYSDCYEAPGFTGGYWGADSTDKLMNWYYLGWENKAAHTEYTETDLFWLEINKLAPHMAGGEADFYTFTQQT